LAQIISSDFAIKLSHIVFMNIQTDLKCIGN
jgi:hypothetical protein